MRQETLIEPATLKHQRILEFIRKWGDVNSDGLLEESCQIFSIDGVDGFIGYKIELSNAIVFGDPVCAPEEKSVYAQAFQSYCESQKIGTVYTMVSQEFADWAVENLSATSIEFGEKFIVDPQNNPFNHSGPNAVLVRKKVKHAIKEGVSVKEYLNQDPHIEQGILEVSKEWLQKRHGPQVFLCHLNLFKDRQGKRYFYAEKEGKIIGLLILNAMQAKKGWMLNNLMIAKATPSGLSELLVVTALQIIAKEDCHYAVVGPFVADQLGRIMAMGEIKATFIRWIFKFVKFVLRLDGQRIFWNKFKHGLEGCYLIFPKNNLNFTSLKALLQAFNIKKN
jgi:lysylphosphatidylglycerol synthetase-like protein (DUF2156 family)